jgi:hypothetical protein
MKQTLKQKIAPYVKMKLTDAEIALLMGVSRQRIYQARTGYKSPAHRRAKRYKNAA